MLAAIYWPSAGMLQLSLPLHAVLQSRHYFFLPDEEAKSQKLSNPKSPRETKQMFKSRYIPAQRPGTRLILGCLRVYWKYFINIAPDLLNFMTEIMTKILFSVIVRKWNWNVYLVLYCLIKDLDESKFIRSIKFELLREQEAGLWEVGMDDGTLESSRSIFEFWNCSLSCISG